MTTPEVTTPTISAPEQETSPEAKKPSKKDKHADAAARPAGEFREEDSR